MLLERNIRRCKGRKRLRGRRNGSGPTTANENGRGNYAVPRFSGDRWGQFCEPHLLHSKAVALNFSVDWNEGIGIPRRISFVRVRHQLGLIGTYGTMGYHLLVYFSYQRNIPWLWRLSLLEDKYVTANIVQ